MHSAIAAANDLAADNCGNSAEPVKAAAAPHSLGVLLSALTTVLRDTLSRFEAISSQVTDHVLSRGDAEDHKLIVVLQDFDRLQQEFSALGDVISHCAAASSAGQLSDSEASLEHAAIAKITLSDLKARFMRHIQDSELESVRAIEGGEEEF
jgi:hypothetical protein